MKCHEHISQLHCIAATSLDTIDVDWMFEHSKQARRMMPGGVTVIGAFFVSSDAAETTFKSSKVCPMPNLKIPPRTAKNFPGFRASTNAANSSPS